MRCATLRDQTPEAIQSLPVIALWSELAVQVDHIKDARGAINGLPLLSGLDLNQPASTARMRLADIHLKTMAVIGRFNIDQQGLCAGEPEPVGELYPGGEEGILAAHFPIE